MAVCQLLSIFYITDVRRIGFRCNFYFEPQNRRISNRRISKREIAALYLFWI